MPTNKINRNDPCPCGSGKKYKQCCLVPENASAAAPASKKDVADLWQAAISSLNAGQFEQANTLCQSILEVSPENPDALNMQGMIAYQIGMFDIAIELFSAVVTLVPGAADVYNNLGNAFKEEGRLDDAVRSYRQAISLKPNHALAHYNLGNALKALGRTNEAVASYQQSIAHNPNNAFALNNLGDALQQMGKLKEAAASYRRAIQSAPDLAEPYYNLGDALNALGEREEAANSYRRAISLKPEYAEAYSNLGNVLSSSGHLEEAIVNFRCALRLGEAQKTKAAFARCINDVRFSHEIEGLRPLVLRALAEGWDRPGDLATAAISLIKLQPALKECIDRANLAWPERLDSQELYGESGFQAVAEDSLLHRLLSTTSACDVEMERFLTMSRRALLDIAFAKEFSDGASDEIGLNFYCALARQFFINEYVFAVTDEELRQARSLCERMISAANAPVPALWLVAVAAYFPLGKESGIASLANRPWPDAVNALVVQQVHEPAQEQGYRSAITILTAIESNVSTLVQQQYEQNPYPRWVIPPLVGEPISFASYLRQQVPSLPPTFVAPNNSKTEILIAGCGTGQHSIATAQAVVGAEVLAIDLSLTSLCYAKRKTDELGLKNIHYAQADILKLGALGRTFDVIESVGVLHHMADPMAGWKVLQGLLRPGGFMRLGFYSEIGRKSLVLARSYIAEHGYRQTAEDIRRFRQDWMDAGNDHEHKRLLSFRDFYGMSECRDLLFHVQEHRYALPQIRAALTELNLDFIGFQLYPAVRQQYQRRFPDDLTLTDLECWNKFEIENPDTFFGMYQFWVQKAAA
jgi:tetratricopeptide (TPR) repeat protein/2-polyprenyl-3-methyl-5-hydroxy-6-metoxy-1,4-benzoquinol methylase